MKHLVLATAAAAAIAVFQTVALAAPDAESAKADLKEHGCLMCHSITKKKVGPAYQDVAAQFKGKTAADLMAAMKSKSVHASVLKKTDDSELKEMIEYILTLSK